MRDAGERDRGTSPAASPLRRGDHRVAGRGGLGQGRPLEPAGREPRYACRFQYANEANPRAHYDGTARRSPRRSTASTCSSGLGTGGGTLMGTGARLRESFPGITVAAAEPLPGDSVMGLRSLEDGYVPPILDVSKLDRKVLVSNAESVAALRRLLDEDGIFAGVSSGAVVHVARKLAPSATTASSSACSPTAAGSTCRPGSGTPTTSRPRWRTPSGGDPRRRARGARAARA